MTTNLPQITAPIYKEKELWIRLDAFLSLKSKNTQITYRGILSEWCEFLGAAVGSYEAALMIQQATDLHATAYAKWLRGRIGQKPRAKYSDTIKNSVKKTSSKESVKNKGVNNKRLRDDIYQTNATIWKKFAALRRMYRVIISSGIGPKLNPFDVDRVPPPPKESGRKRPTEMLSYELVKKIIQTPDVSTPKGQRDRAILAALFGGGLRRSEAAGLRLCDVRVTKNKTYYLYLKSTKGGTDAEQAIPEWTAKELLLLKSIRERDGALSGDPLFVSYRGRAGAVVTDKAISHTGIYLLFKQYCLCEGEKFVSPHSARATAITRLLDEGFSHRLVKDFSRHKSVQMVELYDKRRAGVDENLGGRLKY